MTMECTSHKCAICECDVCSACAEEDIDGYSHYCPACWKIGEPYRKIIDITTTEFYKRVDAITAQWKEEINRRNEISRRIDGDTM